MSVSSTISGNPQVGQLFTESGTANGGETLTAREWQQGGTEAGAFTAIAGATSATFTTTGAQQGKWIRCVVSYDDGGNTVLATSNAIGPIGRGSGGHNNPKRPAEPAMPVPPPPPPVIQKRIRTIVPVDTTKWSRSYP